MKQFFRTSRLSAIAMSAAILCGCAKHDDHATRAGENEIKIEASIDLTLLKNEDVRWNGTYHGLDPELHGTAMQVLKQVAAEYKLGRHETRDKLVALLSDNERFIVAHVLLTRSMYEKKYTIDGARWNGLEVHMRNDGSAQIDPEQRAGLASKWKNENASH